MRCPEVLGRFLEGRVLENYGRENDNGNHERQT